MRLLVAIATHFVRDAAGSVYTDGPHRYGFWQRYLEVFDEVLVLARVRSVGKVETDWARVDGAGVSVCGLPDHVGPWQYLANRSKLQSIAAAAVADADAYLLRSGGGAVLMLAWKEIRALHRPYAVEVTADPWDALGPGTVKTWTRPIGRRLCARNLRLQCRHAAAAIYVTRQALQRRYPAWPDALSMGCSDVEMPDDAYVAQPRTFSPNPVRLVHVGTLGQFYKGPDVLVRAVAECVSRGLPLRLRILGAGQRRAELEALTRLLGVEDHVQMLGQLGQRSQVLKELDDADLFVLPSRQEGLPRALVEAMGRALPCIGSTVGGIPELLAPEDMVPPGDSVALADKIIQVLRDPQRMARTSARNLSLAAEYRSAVLAPKRREFYRHVRALSDG